MERVSCKFCSNICHQWLGRSQVKPKHTNEFFWNIRDGTGNKKQRELKSEFFRMGTRGGGQSFQTSFHFKTDRFGALSLSLPFYIFHTYYLLWISVAWLYLLLFLHSTFWLHFSATSCVFLTTLFLFVSIPLSPLLFFFFLSLFHTLNLSLFYPVWQEENRQMSIKVAQKLFH